MKKAGLLLITQLIFILNISFAEDTKTVKLKQQKISYTPANYHIGSVLDERPDTTSIGYYHTRLSNKEVNINLENGVASSLKNYIDKNLLQDKSLPEISLHITRLDVTEKKAGLAVQMDLNCTLAFYVNGTKLIEYTGSSYTQSINDPSAYIETMLRQNIEKSIKDFDKWLDNNKNSLITDAPIDIEVIIAKTTDDPEQVVYSKNIRLQTQDFQGQPDDLNSGAAATYSGIDFKYTTETRNYNTKVIVTLTPYFDRSKSWKRTQNLPASVLEHEQRHFDITGYKACELADSIAHHSFTKENFGKELKDLLRKTDKDISALQSQYDTETNHGTNAAKQQQWNKTIRDKLKELSCY